MAINWKKFQRELDDLVEDAGNRTDRRLAGKASNITRLTDEEVRRLFPDPDDVKKLAELMEIVKKSGSRNAKINKLVDDAEGFAGVILKLLEKIA